MAITVTRDPDGGPGECCFHCFSPTTFWYEPKDVACCPSCAKTVEPADVPTKAAWCRAVLAKYPRLRARPFPVPAVKL